MSTFKAEVVLIEEVQEHPDADRLDIVRIRGWRAITQRGLYRVGDLVVYIPEDAILPSLVLEALGFIKEVGGVRVGTLSGKQGNRVKAMRLRGVLSQGVIMSKETLRNLTGFEAEEGADVTAFLGIGKYEEPIPIHMSGLAVPRPSWMPKYTDIENINNFPEVLQDGERVAITEKLHGACASYGKQRGGEMFVSSRNLCLARDAGNVYWRAGEAAGAEALLDSALATTGAQSAVLYGEVLGVQDLKYGHDHGNVGLRLFDLMVDGEYVDHLTASPFLAPLLVPILYEGPFSREVLLEQTSGVTLAGGPHIREGVVVRPLIERYDTNLGRVILKSISPDYLTRKGGTEFQ